MTFEANTLILAIAAAIALWSYLMWDEDNDKWN